jgi:uncharacterized SAM-binding protein YcdF (DUF218 family)
VARSPSSSSRRVPFLAKFTIALAALLVIAFLARSLWLPAVAYALIRNDGPAKADIAVVLAGDFFGHRLEKAAQLVKQGYVPAVLVSGPPGVYGRNEADLATEFIEREGYSSQWFIPFPDPAHSTREEAGYILQELRRRNVHSFLLVTSDFHTARAARIFLTVEKAMDYHPQFRTVTAPDEYFRADSWWHDRDAQKTVFFEWSKTIATALGK